MINIHDGQITDLLSNTLRYNPETISIGYAILQEKRRILYLAERTLLMAAVEILDEKTLDYLAVELRTPAYSDSYPLETKRTLIKGTLPFYSKLGTPAAVDWVINAIFGSGGIEEWFSYGGEPHHFRIHVTRDHAATSWEDLKQFLQAVYLVKRLSSWLDEMITTLHPTVNTLRLGGTMSAAASLPTPEERDRFDFRHTLRLGGTMSAVTSIPIPEQRDVFHFRSPLCAGGRLSVRTRLPVPQAGAT